MVNVLGVSKAVTRCDVDTKIGRIISARDDDDVEEEQQFQKNSTYLKTRIRQAKSNHVGIGLYSNGRVRIGWRKFGMVFGFKCVGPTVVPSSKYCFAHFILLWDPSIHVVLCTRCQWPA